MQPIDLAGVINAAIDVVRPAADAKAIEIVTSLDPATAPISGDSVRLRQVIWNLLSNSLRFTPKRGRVEIRLERAGTYMVVVVTDNGEGIAPDFLPHIFERFQQADTTASRQHGGLGLGLSIVRQLVQLHGGSIRAASEGEGHGASFTITLPILALMDSGNSGLGSHSASSDLSGSKPRWRRAKAAKSEAPPDLRSDLLNGLKVLAIDDQADTRELITVALMRYGAKVRACMDATAALEMLREWKPDIIISDIGMPGEDGYELMKRIRALAPARGGRIPAIALTGYAGAVEESKALAAGYQTHIPKPVELSALAATIAKLCSKSKVRRK